MASDPEFGERDGEEPLFDVPPFVSGLIFGRSFAAGEVPEDTGDPALEWSPSRMLDLVESSSAGPTSMTILEGLAPRQLNSFDRVRLMREWDRQIGHCQAKRLAAMKAVVDDAADRAFVSHEIAAALHVTRPVADHLVNVCRRLARTLPVTARALADGRISEPQAIVISDETGPLTAELAGQVEHRLIPNAQFQTIGQFRAAVRKLVAALDPEGFAARHAQQRTQTDVTVTDFGDGVSGLMATMTTPDAAIVKTAVDAWADHHHTLMPETTVAERRCAALVDWARHYLAGPGVPSRHGHRVNIDVIIDLPTLLGLAEHPGEIPGYGIIPADLARQLAADGTWRRLVTDPQTGHLIDCGTRRYRPTQQLTDYLLARERVSAFPGSTTPSARCDIDHAIPHPHGGTDRDNLGPFDRRAHRAKTHTDWKAHRTPDGTTHWTSPDRTPIPKPATRLPTRVLHRSSINVTCDQNCLRRLPLLPSARSSVEVSEPWLSAGRIGNQWRGFAS